LLSESTLNLPGTGCCKPGESIFSKKHLPVIPGPALFIKAPGMIEILFSQSSSGGSAGHDALTHLLGK